MVGGGMQDDLASNLRSKVKNLQYLRFAILVAGSLVVDPDGRCVLKGWRETDGPGLWHFPLTAAKPSPPVPAALHGMHGDWVPHASAADLS